MKNILFLFLLYSFSSMAQTGLHFDKGYVECEDQWVAFEKGKNNDYIYGFIYIDEVAGLTLNYEGTFTISEDDVFHPRKLDTASVKVRLEHNNVKVAIIPEQRFAQLKITKTPDWLKYYKTDTSSVKHLFHWGFLYNSWDQTDKALSYLERAQKIDPTYPGLATELGYTYNVMGKFEKAIELLEYAIKATPKDCYPYKELSYAQMNSGHLDKAEITGKNGIASCSDSAMKAEIAHNLAYHYYKESNAEKFHYWAAQTHKWSTPGDRFMVNIESMEAKFGK